MNWTCEHVEERLTDYLDRLLPPAEREAVSAHLSGCRHCSALARQVGALVDGMHHLEPIEPPARLVYAILDGTTHAAPSGMRTWLRWLGPLGTPRFAMGVVTVALFLAILTPALGINWQEFQWSDLKPGNLYNAMDRRANLMYARGVKFVNELRVVYEIQNRLQPVSDSQPAGEGEGEQPPAEQKEEEKPGQKTNRAREWETLPITLATLTGGLPGRID